MMRSIIFKSVSALLLLIVIISCRKDSLPPASDTVLIFGEYYGFCVGDCAFIYKHEKEELFADEIENFYSQDLVFSTKALASNKAREAKALLDNFPVDLFDEKSTIGSPDSHDQGGYYLQYIQEGRNGEWRIDTDQGSIPKYLHGYINDLQRVLELLKN